jgi:hypothetical protein
MNAKQGYGEPRDEGVTIFSLNYFGMFDSVVGVLEIMNGFAWSI